MATEAGGGSKPPSPVLLGLLGLTIAGAVIFWLMGSAGSGTPSSNPSGTQRPAQARTEGLRVLARGKGDVTSHCGSLPGLSPRAVPGAAWPGHAPAPP